tara:strand:+ start:701 stop:1207 length:507 start_codon:yes stop_codon:yes gene_type:complete
MALWGNSDAVGSVGTVILNYDTGAVTGTATSFGSGTGAAAVGDIIQFGTKATTFFGNAVIVAIGDTNALTIGSTAGLSGAAIAGVEYSISQLPKSSVLDSTYSKKGSPSGDSFVYAVNPNGGGAYEASHEGWVGVTTYMGAEGEVRVKKEVLVAMSGITTGNTTYPTP